MSDWGGAVVESVTPGEQRSWVRVGREIELFPEDTTPDLSVDFCFPDDPPSKRMVRNVTRPTLTPYLPAPDRATGLGVVVCPGGWNHFLAVRHEGEDVAAALAQRGVAAFVLRYRVQRTAESDDDFAAQLASLAADPGSLAAIAGDRVAEGVADGAAALDLVRLRADEWGVDPARVGILGFSAGAFVATRTTVSAPVESRPAFVGAIYGGPWGGPGPEPGAPPLFSAWARDDDLGPLVLGTCEPTAAAWREVGSPVEVHVFDDGGHGFGMLTRGTASDAWFELFMDWLGRLSELSPGRS